MICRKTLQFLLHRCGLFCWCPCPSHALLVGLLAGVGVTFYSSVMWHTAILTLKLIYLLCSPFCLQNCILGNLCWQPFPLPPPKQRYLLLHFQKILPNHDWEQVFHCIVIIDFMWISPATVPRIRTLFYLCPYSQCLAPSLARSWCLMNTFCMHEENDNVLPPSFFSSLPTILSSLLSVHSSAGLCLWCLCW